MGLKALTCRPRRNAARRASAAAARRLPRRGQTPSAFRSSSISSTAFSCAAWCGLRSVHDRAGVRAPLALDLQARRLDDLAAGPARRRRLAGDEQSGQSPLNLACARSRPLDPFVKMNGTQERLRPARRAAAARAGLCGGWRGASCDRRREARRRRAARRARRSSPATVAAMRIYQRRRQRGRDVRQRHPLRRALPLANAARSTNGSRSAFAPAPSAWRSTPGHALRRAGRPRRSPDRASLRGRTDDRRRRPELAIRPRRRAERPHRRVRSRRCSDRSRGTRRRRSAAHPRFPDGTNVHVARIDGDADSARAHYERGAGSTQACGTGAVAVAVAAIDEGLASSPVDVDVPGGTLRVSGSRERATLLEGPAESSSTNAPTFDCHVSDRARVHRRARPRLFRRGASPLCRRRPRTPCRTATN